MGLAARVIEEDEPEESQRRFLLAESDRLLDQVETLRLMDEEDAPHSLREAIRLLQVRLGRKDPPLPPATLHAAHDLVFAVQQRLMAANPKHPRPNRHRGRAEGQPIVTRVYDGRLWKVLALPTPPNGSAQQHAVRAARSRHQPRTALAVARIAWANYWDLGEEARRIRSRLGARASSTSSGGRGARAP